MSLIRRFTTSSSVALLAVLAFGCSSAQSSTGGITASYTLPDGGVGPSPTPCPRGKIQAPTGSSCVMVVPSSLGLSGDNSNDPSIALTPSPGATPTHQLVLFINGTGGHPGDDIPKNSPTVNFYDTAATQGYSVLAVSYRSKEAVNTICTPDGGTSPVDSCLFPTRKTLIVGALQAGAAAQVSDIIVGESVAGRALATLHNLAAYAPNAGWDSFYTTDNLSAPPAQQLVWSKIVTAGHSQGGGHAAAIARLFPVARVVQLSATCDAYGTGTDQDAIPATWTTGSLDHWYSDPSQFWGLGTATTFTDGTATGGDVNCFTHLAVWNNLGMVSSHQNDCAVTCPQVSLVHDASINCPGNASAWAAMLQ